MAGNPTVFPDQVNAPPELGKNDLEGLHRWQPKKIYYFTQDQTLDLTAYGPCYNNTVISPSRNVSYQHMAYEAASQHGTQGDFRHLASALAEDERLKRGECHVDQFRTEFQRLYEFDLFPDRLTFIAEKSHVGGNRSDDIFAHIAPGAIAFVPPYTGYAKPHRDIDFTIGGPWLFYHEFWQAHQISDPLVRIGNCIDPDTQYAIPEIAIAAGAKLHFPALLHNRTDTSQDVQLSLQLPSGWPEASVQSTSQRIAAHTSYDAAAIIPTPAVVSDAWHSIIYVVDVDGRRVDSITLSVQLRQSALIQQ